MSPIRPTLALLAPLPSLSSPSLPAQGGGGPKEALGELEEKAAMDVWGKLIPPVAMGAACWVALLLFRMFTAGRRVEAVMSGVPKVPSRYPLSHLVDLVSGTPWDVMEVRTFGGALCVSLGKGRGSERTEATSTRARPVAVKL